MLVFHQAIMIPNLNLNLLCPNQMRANDLRVNDEPKHCIDQPTEDHHVIVVHDINRKNPQALNKVTKCHTMLVQDSFLGSLIVLPVEL